VRAVWPFANRRLSLVTRRGNPRFRRVEVSTTSDWTEVEVDGADWTVDWLAADINVPMLHVYTTTGLRLEKPCCTETRATVQFDLLVSPSGA